MSTKTVVSSIDGYSVIGFQHFGFLVDWVKSGWIFAVWVSPLERHEIHIFYTMHCYT